MMDKQTIKAALRGDADAAAECTAAGVAIPCPLFLDCLCEYGEAHKSKPTNADRIRSMSDEELAEWILQLVDCGKENVMCNPTEYKLSGKCNGRCLQGRLDWLRQPAETEGKK